MLAFGDEERPGRQAGFNCYFMGLRSIVSGSPGAAPDDGLHRPLLPHAPPSLWGR